MRTGQDISEEEINTQKEFLDRVDQSTLANYEDLEKRKLEDLRLERKEGDPQAEVAQDLTGLLQAAVEPPEEERIKKASEQVLVEGASKEEVEAERTAAIAAQEALKRQQDRERVDKEFLQLTTDIKQFLDPVPVVTFMKNLLTKQRGRGNALNQEAVSFILKSIKQINEFRVPYLKENVEYSFKMGDLKSYPQVKKLYILSFLLKRVRKVKQLSEQMKQEIKVATENFDKIFSSGMTTFLNAVDETVKTTEPKYAGFIQRIRDLNN